MISNSTPIILLGRINRLEVLQRLFGRISIPEAVKKEVFIEDKPGYIPIKKALEEKWIRLHKPTIILPLHLGKGETEAISLAREKKEPLIIDDAFAINAAKTYNIKIFRTTTVIFMAFHQHIFNKTETINAINLLIQEGYYIKPSEYAALLNRLHELTD